MSLDSCLSIHMYLRILCKIHVSDLCLSIFISQGPLQDPCLRIHVSASFYLRILCKIHVSGSMCPIHVLASTNIDPLHDPCLRAHVSASLRLRILYKIHVFGFMSQHLCISGSSTRSMSPIHVSASTKMDRLQDPCLRIHISATICISGSSARSMSPDPCLRFMSQHPLTRIRCMIHVSVFMSRHPYLWILSKIRISAFKSVDPAQNRHGAFFVALRRENAPMEILFNVSRRRNAHFDLPRRILCGPAQAKRKFDLPRRVLCPYHVDSRGVTTR